MLEETAWIGERFTIISINLGGTGEPIERIRRNVWIENTPNEKAILDGFWYSLEKNLGSKYHS